MRFIRNVVSKIFRRSSTKKDEQTYINMDEVRKAQQKKEQVVNEVREITRRNFFFIF